jgi:hypothetical protein
MVLFISLRNISIPIVYLQNIIPEDISLCIKTAPKLMECKGYFPRLNVARG